MYLYLYCADALLLLLLLLLVLILVLLPLTLLLILLLLLLLLLLLPPPPHASLIPFTSGVHRNPSIRLSDTRLRIREVTISGKQFSGKRRRLNSVRAVNPVDGDKVLPAGSGGEEPVGKEVRG